MRGDIPPLPNTPSWRSAQLKRRAVDFTFTFTWDGNGGNVRVSAVIFRQFFKSLRD
jgi:hypothetical protein